MAPAYTAVKEWAPDVLKLVLSVALPLLKLAVPRTVVPSLKVTVPVAAVGVTVAVKAVDWPTPDGFTDEVKAVVVDVEVETVTETALEVLVP